MAEDTNKNKKHFFKEMKAELKKVNWLTPKQLLNNTTAVIVMVIVVTAIVFVLDFTFENITSHGIEGLKSIVQQDETNTTDDTTQNDEESNSTTDETSENTTDNTVEENTSNETENNQTESNEVQE